MNFTIEKVRVSIDHITLTSDDRRFIKFKPEILAGYKCPGWEKIAKSSDGKHMRKSYWRFYPYRNLVTGNKVHIFVDRYNTESYKTLYMPNITVKFFSSWDNRLTYADVVWVHNILVQKYDVHFSVSMVHVAVDLYFRGDDDPFLWVLGSIKSGRKVTPKKHSDYPNTYLFQRPNAPFCLAVYDKRQQLLDKKLKELSAESMEELKKRYVTRLESRFRNPCPICSLEELATKDFSFIYPRHIAFLKADRGKLGNHGIKGRQYRGLGLPGLRTFLRRKGIKNNFTYYLREIRHLANPVKAALAKYRWDRHPDRHPLSSPKLKIRKQRLKFTKHS